MTTATTATSATRSIQIPDLPSLTRSFELHTNQACHSTALSSEAWFLGNHDDNDTTPVLSDQQERSILPSAKFGLLSGLCFPTCDPTQLRLLTDFVTVLGLAYERVLRAQTVDEVGWSQSGSWTTDSNSDDRCKRGIEILNDHELFKHLTYSISKLTSQASKTWHTRFSTSVLAYKRAQLDPLFWGPEDSRKRPETNDGGTTGTDPLDRFVSLKRHTNGAHMVFDLVEFALGHRPLEAIYEDTDEEEDSENRQTRRAVLIHSLEALRNLAADIVSLSSDVVAYNKFQFHHPGHPGRRMTTLPHNAVAFCMLSKHVSVQGATNMVVKLVKDKIHEFLEIEQALRHLCTLIDKSKWTSGLGSAYSWMKSSLSSLTAGNSQAVGNPVINSLCMLPQNDRSARLIGQLIAYTQVLHDYIAGNIHWFYETELYFGTKGDHVREFRWIFLAEPDS